MICRLVCGGYRHQQDTWGCPLLSSVGKSMLDGGGLQQTGAQQNGYQLALGLQSFMACVVFFFSPPWAPMFVFWQAKPLKEPKPILRK